MIVFFVILITPTVIGFVILYRNDSIKSEIRLARNSSFAELEDGSKASSPSRSCSSPSLQRPLDDFDSIYLGGLADRRHRSSEGPRPPRQCAKLTSRSSPQKGQVRRASRPCGGKVNSLSVSWLSVRMQLKTWLVLHTLELRQPKRPMLRAVHYAPRVPAEYCVIV